VILPSPSSATEPYWQAAREGKLLLRCCESCKRWFHPQRIQCPCAKALAWRESSGHGILIGHSVIHHRFNPAMEGLTPYTLTLTRLDEGPQLLTSMPGAHALVCGMKMGVEFDPVTPEVTLPRFVPVRD